MKKSGFSIGGLLLCIMGGGCALGALVCLVTSKILLGVVCAVLAFLFIRVGIAAFSKKKAKASSYRFMKNGGEAKALVEEVLANSDIQTIINSKSFSEKGVKFITVDNSDKCSVVLTKDCIYESVLGSFDYPANGVRSISFVKGREVKGIQRVKLDEEKMAKMGYAVGGFGGAAMNVASAKKINSQGGAEVEVNSGFFSFDLKVRSEISEVYVVIIRKDYIKVFGNIFEDCPVKNGEYYNAYYVQNIKGGNATQKACEQMTVLLRKIQAA